jgi:hypothetical protein
VADDYGFGPYGNNFNDPDVQEEIDALNPGGVKGFMQGIGNFYKTVSPFLNAKRALAKGQDFALDLIQKAKDAAAARELAKLQEAARAAGFQGDTRTQSEQDLLLHKLTVVVALEVTWVRIPLHNVRIYIYT